MQAYSSVVRLHTDSGLRHVSQVCQSKMDYTNHTYPYVACGLCIFKKNNWFENLGSNVPRELEFPAGSGESSAPMPSSISFLICDKRKSECSEVAILLYRQ